MKESASCDVLGFGGVSATLYCQHRVCCSGQEAIEGMGDKIKSKKIAKNAGVDCIPVRASLLAWPLTLQQPCALFNPNYPPASGQPERDHGRERSRDGVQ
jgi:hypothetical protein